MQRVKKIAILSIIFIVVLHGTSCQYGNTPSCIECTDIPPAMIINQQQDNRMEGKYLKVYKACPDSGMIHIELPEDFHITNNNCQHWLIGWGDQKPYHDAGVENLRAINSVDAKKNIIITGDLQRGDGFPAKNQEVALWNRHPMGFRNNEQRPVVHASMWPEFAGNSLNLGGVIFDDSIGHWVMVVTEFDTCEVQAYAAISNDLRNWLPANQAKPILQAGDFNHCTWVTKDSSGNTTHVPFITDMVKSGDRYFLFMHSMANDSIQRIGMALSSQSALGPYKIMKDAIIEPNHKWCSQGTFFAKVATTRKGFILAFDGMDKDSAENTGVAYSNDLFIWTYNQNNPVINSHRGWRSNIYSSEPTALLVRDDTLFLFATGVKKFRENLWARFITRDRYQNKPGNTDDIQTGLWISTNDGTTFKACCNNPVFINDYSNPPENSHMGAAIEFIETDTLMFCIYQAKTDNPGKKYNILLREKRSKKLFFENK